MLSLWRKHETMFPLSSFKEDMYLYFTLPIWNAFEREPIIFLVSKLKTKNEVLTFWIEHSLWWQVHPSFFLRILLTTMSIVPLTHSPSLTSIIEEIWQFLPHEEQASSIPVPETSLNVSLKNWIICSPTVDSSLSFLWIYP